MGEYNIDYRVITGKYIRWVPTEKHKTNYGMGEYKDKSDRGIVPRIKYYEGDSVTSIAEL